jgi:hypothetical protein
MRSCRAMTPPTQSSYIPVPAAPVLPKSCRYLIPLSAIHTNSQNYYKVLTGRTASTMTCTYGERSYSVSLGSSVKDAWLAISINYVATSSSVTLVCGLTSSLLASIALADFSFMCESFPIYFIFAHTLMIFSSSAIALNKMI